MTSSLFAILAFPPTWAISSKLINPPFFELKQNNKQTKELHLLCVTFLEASLHINWAHCFIHVAR